MSRRARTRAATIAEIKQTALNLMRQSGTIDVRFTDIARAMGMTAPAMYRYYADRDDLVNALIADAFNDLGEAIAAARDTVPREDIGGRWRAAATAYRQWANKEPQLFTLILGLPMPGYVAPAGGLTSEASRRALFQFVTLFVDAQRTGQLRPPLLKDVDPAVVQCVQQKMAELSPEKLPQEVYQAMLHAWCSLHGFVALEAYGHLHWMSQEGRDALFDSHIRTIAQISGLPVANWPDG